MRWRWTIISFFCLLTACKSDLPKDVISVNTMQDVMTDMLLAEGFAENFLLLDTSKSRDYWYSQEYSKVMAIHKISQKDFRRSIQFYKTRPDLFKVIVDTVSQRGLRHRDRAYESMKNRKLKMD